MSDAPPAGYVRVTAGRCSAIVLQEHEGDARRLLAEGTLYESAARDLAARPLSGRGIAYLIALPDTGTHAVVRHNRHGGVFAPVTRDLFLPPTRAPWELAASRRRSEAGVHTPRVLMYVMPGQLEHRADAWAAARALVAALDAAGARHHDLNVKNILLARRDGGLVAYALDVDRVRFTSPTEAAAGNRARLLRSARKWREERGAEFEEGKDY
jgi:hypothetical protein